MTEQAIQSKIRKYLEKRGFIVLKVGNVYKAGFPDLMVLPHEDSDFDVFFLEVKRPGKKPTDLQIYWMERLIDQGYPAMWTDNADSVKKLIEGGPEVKLGLDMRIDIVCDN